MKPRSMASRALLMLVMANGIQKGFILRYDCTTSGQISARLVADPRGPPYHDSAELLFTTTLQYTEVDVVVAVMAMLDMQKGCEGVSCSMTAAMYMSINNIRQTNTYGRPTM